MRLRGKVSVITGGSQGIGNAIARAFAREGSHLILSARTESDLKLAKKELEGLSSGKVAIFAADVSRPGDARALTNFALQEFATIDILVNCAGIYGPIGPITEIDEEKWLEAIHINLYGTFLCIKAALPSMVKSRRGKIINLSGGGATNPFPRFSAYSTSKAAVVRLTETVAEEVKEFHIDVNAIAPGAVNTRLLSQALEAGEAAGTDFLARAIRQKEEGGVPPEKAAELAVFLASSRSDGLTGRLISAVWDSWGEIPQRLGQIMSSDIYAMRRIVPKDRGYDW